MGETESITPEGERPQRGSPQPVSDSSVAADGSGPLVAGPVTRPPGLSRSVLMALQRSAGNATVARYLLSDAQRPASAAADNPAARAEAATRTDDETIEGGLRAAVAQRNGVRDDRREGRSGEAVASGARLPAPVAVVQRSPWDTVKNAAGDAWDGAKDLAGKAKDLLVKKILGPLRDIAGSIGKAVSSVTTRFAKALSQTKPDFLDYLAPGNLMLKTLMTVRRDIYAEAIVQERSQRQAANAAGTPQPGAQVEPGPLEKIDGVARSVEDFGTGVMDVEREIVEGAILGDFKENPSIWNTIGQVAVGFVPYAGQVADVRDLVANIKKLHEHGWTRPGDWFDLVLTGIGFIPGVGDAVKAIGRGAKGAIKKGVKWIASGGRKLWSKFGRQLPALWKGLKRFGSTALRGVGSAAKKLVGKAGSFARGLLGRAKGLAQRAGAFAVKIGERVSSIAKGIGDVARGAASKAKGLIGKLAGALPGPLRGVYDTITGAVKRGAKFASDGAKKVGDVVRGLKKRATDFLKNAAKRASDMARNVRERVGKMRRAAGRWIREKTTWVSNKVTQVRKAGVSGVTNWLRGKVKSVKDGIVKVVKSGVRKTRDRVRKWLGKERAKTAPEGEPPKRTFTSPDPLVGDLANSIEEAVPGKIIDVNVNAYTEAGVKRTDYDIELDDAVIQVKSGSGKGLGAQISRTQETTGKKIIAYGPELGKHVQAEARKRGAIVFTSKDDLLRYLKGE